MGKIKITFIASTFTIGGAETVMKEVIKRLPKNRFETELLLLKEPGVIGERLFRGGIRGASRLQKGRYDAGVLFKLTSLLKGFSPHIVFCLDHRDAMFWGRLSSLFARVPKRVVASHATGRMGGRKSFSRWDRALMRVTDAVVAVTEPHAAYLRDVEGIDGKKIVVIENGIDTDRYEWVNPRTVSEVRRDLGISERNRVVLMVAAIRPEKAHDVLLDAAKTLVESDDSLKFLVVGDGPARSALEAKKRRLGLEGSVFFLGARDDVPALLKLSQVLVLPSHAAVETLPLAVLEAMASGVPVVASAVGSLPELIEDGLNGKLIPPADSGGLGAAIRYIINNKPAADRMAENARSLVHARFTLDRMISGYGALFEGMVN